MSTTRSPVAFGPYVITRRIARGGMAEIYRGRTRGADARWVAIKMMRSSLGHEELRERLFQREARIASMLHHPNVVPIFEYGQEMDRPYLAMEYVQGRDLSHLLKSEKRGRELVPLEIGLYIGLEAAAGLGHAHRLTDPNTGRSLGIVHRDISPGNVMVGYDGSVKVLDFGVARINETQGVHTQTGTLRGKFAYMSPEQTLGDNLDARSDVFSLGTVLYELFTGINCFRAQNPIATLERVQGLRPVPPSRANRSMPKAVDRILARCLAKDSARRFKDAAALCDAIADYLAKSSFDGRAALAAHMAETFSWEKHEEEAELAREEDEVALFDVIDFSKLSDDSGLDAANVAVSMEEEASESEVKNVARQVRHETAENEVFEGEDRPSSRAGSRGAMPVPGEDEATIAQRGLLDNGPERPGQQLSVSSLLEGGRPVQGRSERGASVPSGARDAVVLEGGRPVQSRSERGASLPSGARSAVVLEAEAGPAPASPINPLLTRAGTADGPPRPDPQTAAATVMYDGAAGRARMTRPVIVGSALALAVAVVALVVTLGVSESSSGDAPQLLLAPTTIEPVTITIDSDEEPAKEDPRRHRPIRLPGPPSAPRADGATPVSARAPDSVRPEDRLREGEADRLAARADPPRREEVPEKPIAEAEKRPRVVAPPPPPPPPAPPKRKPIPRARPVKPPKKVPTGYLNVGAKPWAEIKIDGKPWPYQTPQAGIELSAGKHTVTLFNRETGVSKTSVVYIKTGAYRTVMMDMRKK